MPIVNLTDRTLRSLGTEEAGLELRDEKTPGLALRVGKSGKLTFSLSYRMGGRGSAKRRLTLGAYPAVSLAEARLTARECQARIGRGIDPVEELKQDGGPAEVLTLTDLIEAYLASYRGKSVHWARSQERTLRRDVLPVLGARPADEIRRSEVLSLLDGIVARGAAVWANRVRGLIYRVYAWGIERDLVLTNPAFGTRKPVVERPPERVLAEAEIRSAWLAFSAIRPPFSLSLALELVTAQRGGEVLHMRRQDIDGDWWTIPAELTKTKTREHRVFLGPMAQQLIAAAPGEEGWLFASRRTGSPAYLGEQARVVRRLCARFGLEPFTPHDRRRTAATFMASLGVERHILMRVLGHGPQTVTDVYDRYRYEAEIKAAMLKWEEALRRILAGGRAVLEPGVNLGGKVGDAAG